VIQSKTVKVRITQFSPYSRLPRSKGDRRSKVKNTRLTHYVYLVNALEQLTDTNTNFQTWSVCYSHATAISFRSQTVKCQRQESIRVNAVLKVDEESLIVSASRSDQRLVNIVCWLVITRCV